MMIMTGVGVEKRGGNKNGYGTTIIQMG